MNIFPKFGSKKSEIFFWIGIFLFFGGIALFIIGINLVDGEIWGVKTYGRLEWEKPYFGGISCSILGVVDLIVVGILFPRSPRQ